MGSLRRILLALALAPLAASSASDGSSSGSGGSRGSTGSSAGSGGQPTGDVTISNGRFHRNGAPFFPVGNFLTSESASGPRTHVYLSEELSDSDRQHILDVAVESGYNTLSIYTYNENDYEAQKISPYQGGGFGGSFDAGLLATWKSRVDEIVASGLTPIIWLVPDDAPKIHAASDSELQSYITEMVTTFDSLPVLWVLALEADEYWSRSKVNTLGTHLGSATERPVGLHQLSGKSSFMGAAWVDFGAYQYGFGKSWQQIFDESVALSGSLGRPLIGMEYDLDDGDNDERLGLAAAFGGTAGVGNGAPKGLAEFMQGLPAGMTSSRSGDIATLEGGGVTATADMRALTFQKQGRKQ